LENADDMTRLSALLSLLQLGEAKLDASYYKTKGLIGWVGDVIPK
jgi:hypothetical protein